MRTFYLCSVCGNLISKIEDGGTTPSCCGKPMTRLYPGSTDGAVEKHVPVITCAAKSDDLMEVTVAVGSAPHPSETYHFIKWILLETEHGAQRKKLEPGEEPKVIFYIPKDEKIIGAYAYCNLHGLWESIVS